MTTATTMTPAQEIAMLRAANAKLLAEQQAIVKFKVSEKGGISIYGLGGRFPITMYKSQAVALLGNVDRLKTFMLDNDSALKTKE